MWWAVLGCSPGTPPPPAPEDTAQPTPALLSSEVTCDVDASQWTVDAEADAFCGGAKTIWTVDGDYVEIHVVPVVGSATDGTHDWLEGVVPIVGDWRLATNTKTAFSCADAPTVAVELRGLDGVPVACEVHGDPSVLPDTDGLCPAVATAP